jgi:hypothetical protein
MHILVARSLVRRHFYIHLTLHPFWGDVEPVVQHDVPPTADRAHLDPNWTGGPPPHFSTILACHAHRLPHLLQKVVTVEAQYAIVLSPSGRLTACQYHFRGASSPQAPSLIKRGLTRTTVKLVPAGAQDHRFDRLT